MHKNKYILSVQPNRQPKKYPKPSLANKSDLQKALIKKGLKIKIGEILKGGFASQVYQAKLDGKDVVVKHTENLTPFDPTELFLDKQSNNIDSKILTKLQNHAKIKVPKLIYHFPDITTSVMENLYTRGFDLMQKLIINKNFSSSAAKSVGTMLANLTQESRKWKEFPVVQTAYMSIYERGLELRFSYPNTQAEYLELEKIYTSNNRFWSWPDCHPKNVFADKGGNVAFIDFGFSQWADQRFMLPSHLAHIAIYSLAGFIKPDAARDYIIKCINAFNEIESIDEDIFCRYLAMEVLHRANGKWIEGVNSFKQKIKLHSFGLRVFDEKVVTIDKLNTLLINLNQ